MSQGQQVHRTGGRSRENRLDSLLGTRLCGVPHGIWFEATSFRQLGADD